jgi:hypothetical protein
MVYQARPWQDNDEQPDQPSMDDLPLNEDGYIDQYAEEHLAPPEPFEPDIYAGTDNTDPAFWNDAYDGFDEHYWEDEEPDDLGFFEPEEG